MLARLAPGKRHDLLFAAAQLLRRRGIELALIVGGDGPARELVSNSLSALPEAVWIPHVADAPAFLRELDVAVLLSDHEGAPMSLLEAMACGLPVVASAVGGIPAMTSGSGAALLVANQPDAIADAIARLQDDAMRRAMGERGRRWTVEQHPLARTVAAYAELYRSAAP